MNEQQEIELEMYFTPSYFTCLAETVDPWGDHRDCLRADDHEGVHAAHPGYYTWPQ